MQDTNRAVCDNELNSFFEEWSPKEAGRRLNKRAKDIQTKIIQKNEAQQECFILSSMHRKKRLKTTSKSPEVVVEIHPPTDDDERGESYSVWLTVQAPAASSWMNSRLDWKSKNAIQPSGWQKEVYLAQIQNVSCRFIS